MCILPWQLHSICQCWRRRGEELIRCRRWHQRNCTAGKYLCLYIFLLLCLCIFMFLYFYICVFLHLHQRNAELEWTSLSIFFNGSFNSFFCVWLLISLYLCLFQSSPTSLFCLSCFTDFAEELPHGPGPTNLMDYARDHHKETHLVTIIIICK